MHLQACCTIWYISLPFSAKQQRETIKLRFFGEHEHTNLKVAPTTKARDNPVALDGNNCKVQ